MEQDTTTLIQEQCPRLCRDVCSVIAEFVYAEQHHLNRLYELLAKELIHLFFSQVKLDHRSLIPDIRVIFIKRFGEDFSTIKAMVEINSLETLINRFNNSLFEAFVCPINSVFELHHPRP